MTLLGVNFFWAKTYTYPVGDGAYQYLSYAYVLLPPDQDQQILTVGFTTDNSLLASESWNNVPAQRNMRTNIYGSLLTDPVDITVEVDPNWVDPGIDYPKGWDGTVEIPTPDADNPNQYTISTPAQLAGLAELVKTNNMAGKTVVLNEDINLNSLPWSPIGKYDYQFAGNFDGQNHSIINLNVNINDGSYGGLFGFTNTGSIQNLKIVNATVTGYSKIGVVCGNPSTTNMSGITIGGTVKVKGQEYVGGVAGGEKGTGASGSYSDITVDVVAGSYVKSTNGAQGSYVGGVFGYLGGATRTLENINSNIDVIGNSYIAGGITGYAPGGTTFKNCSCSGNVQLLNTATRKNWLYVIGGISGTWGSNAPVTFDKCSFTGTLKSMYKKVTIIDDDNVITETVVIEGFGTGANQFPKQCMMAGYTQSGTNWIPATTGQLIFIDIPGLSTSGE